MTDPRPITPATADGLTGPVSKVYATAETALIELIAAHLRAALSGKDPLTAMLRSTRDLQRDTRAVLDRMDAEASAALSRVLAVAFRRGAGRGGLPGLRASVLRAVTVRLSGLRTGMALWVTGWWRRLTGTAATEKDPHLRRTLLGRTLGRIAGRGVTVPAGGGRTTSATAQAELIVGHAAGGAAIDGHLAALAADGGGLVIVTRSTHPCPVCAPWEDKVLTVAPDGAHPTVAQARLAGLWHPRCRHTVYAWSPGWRRPPHALDHLPGSYLAEQRQRVIEDHIRSWKRRAAAALDEVSRRRDSRRVRFWEAELRAHLAATGLQRSRQRERIDFGHTRPIRHALGD